MTPAPINTPACSLRDLLNEYAVAERNWLPETDGLTLDIGRDIRAVLRNEFGLSDGQIRSLKEAV